MEGPQTLNPNDPKYEDKKRVLLGSKYYLQSTDVNGFEIWMPVDEEGAKAKGFESAKLANDYAAITPGIRTEVETVDVDDGTQELQPTHEVFWTGNKNDPFNIRLLGNTQGGTNVLSTPFHDTDGSLWVYDKRNGEKHRLTEAPEEGKPTGKDIEFLKTEALGDNGSGGFIDFYIVDGKIKSYTRSAAETVIQEGKDKFEVEGGTFYQIAPGRYDFVADPAEKFVPGNTVDVPGVGKMVQTSPNQYQVIEDTVEPGVVRDPVSGRRFIQRTDGNWGAEVKPIYDPELQRVDGMSLLQQRSGDVSQLTPPDIDDIITQALIDGEYDKAFAFQDFRDRPTAQEAFDTALAFARSPADQVLISAIARGEQFVAPPAQRGEIQRVGPQPDFLIEAYQDFQRRTQAGRAPTEEEAATLSARAAAGQTPLTDTLQSRLEELKIENQQLKNDAISLKTQQDQQVFQQNNPSLFGGEDPGLTQFKLDLGLSSGSSMPESTKQTLQDLIANLPDDKKQYAITQAESIHRGELSAEQVIGNLRMFADPTPSTTSTPDTSGEPTPEDNWASSIAAYPDLTRATFDLLGGQNLENMAAWEINVHAGNAGTGGVLEPESRKGRTFDPDMGEWVNPNTGSGANGNDSLPDSTQSNSGEINAGENNPLSFNSDTGSSAGENILLSSVPSIVSETAPTVTGTLLADDVAQGRMGQMEAETIASSLGLTLPNMRSRAGGGTVQPGEITVVGEQGPEIAMMPPGTHILPLGPATKRDIKAAQASGRAYQTGGIVFGDLAPGLQQLQRGRPITPPRGYLFQQGGLTLPSMQALQNLTPTVRESFYGMHGDIGISPADFRQELQTAAPRGTRLPTSRMLPLGRRGVR